MKFETTVMMMKGFKPLQFDANADIYIYIYNKHALLSIFFFHTRAFYEDRKPSHLTLN